jgi:hypothetical protein
MARKRIWDEAARIRFAGGTFGRIDAVRDDGEDRSDFVRIAVDKELARREKPQRLNESRQHG